MKRNKVSERLVEIEHQNNLMQLFNMEGTNPQARRTFMQLSQQKELMKLQKDNAITFPIQNSAETAGNLSDGENINNGGGMSLQSVPNTPSTRPLSSNY